MQIFIYSFPWLLRNTKMLFVYKHFVLQFITWLVVFVVICQKIVKHYLLWISSSMFLLKILKKAG